MKSLTTKQTWILSTIALSGGLTKHSLEKLWASTLSKGRYFKTSSLSNDASFNMRKTLDSLTKASLLRKDKGKKNITLYHISSHIPGLLTVGQPYKPYSRRTMTYIKEELR